MLRESILRPGRARFSKPSVLFFLALLISVGMCLAYSTYDAMLSYPFDFGTINQTAINDSGLYANHGTNQGGLILQPGLINASIFYNLGSNQSYASMAITEQANWSFVAWIKPQLKGVYQVFGGIGLDSQDWIHFYIGNPPYNLTMNCRDNAGGQCNGGASVVPSPFLALNDTWQMVSYVHNKTGSTIKICLNANCTSSAYTLGDVAAFGTYIIGAPMNADLRFYGYMDEASFWNVSLTDEDITKLYNAGAGLTYPFCTANWTCSGYGTCNSSDVRPCNQTTDLNACGGTYTGDYSAFAPQACDFCTPAWSCSVFGLCNMSGNMSCLNVSDANMCSEPFNETLSDYDSNCTFINLSVSIISPENSTLSSAQLAVSYNVNKLANCSLYVNNAVKDTDYLIIGNGSMTSSLVFEGIYRFFIRCADTFQTIDTGLYEYLYMPGSASNVVINEADNTSELMLAILSAVFLTLFIIGVTLRLNIFVFISGIGFLFIGFNYLGIFAFKLLFAVIGVVFILVWAMFGLRPRDDSR